MNETNNDKQHIRTVTGSVVSNKMRDTVVVLVERRVKHKFYSKYMRLSTKLHAHDAGNQCQIGDVVTVRECRPLSKTKTWTLVDIVKRVEA